MNFGVSTSYFKLEIEGIECSEIREIRGFDLFSPDSEKARNNHSRTYTTEMTLTRKFTDLGFFNWLNNNKMTHEVTKKNGKLSFITPDNEEIISFKLEGLFPLVWHGPSLMKGTNWGPDQATEEVILAVEKISQV
ncbi:MAG: phage tail protein [bacterium]